MKYQLLEPTVAESILGESVTFDTNETPSFFASTSFIYTLAFVIIIVTASFRYAYAGTLRLPGGEQGIRKSKEEFTRVTYGLLGVLGLWLILFTVNKDMLTGDVTLQNLKLGDIQNSSEISLNTTGSVSSSGTSVSCSNVESVKAAVQAGGTGICGNTSCSLTACMNNNQYLPLIKSIAGDDWKMALVIMCKESSGNKNAQNKNPNNTYDCGLMQINQTTPCDGTILEPQTNITKGVEELRNKKRISSNTLLYPHLKVKPETAFFTSYNCCANGTVTNAPSTSCLESDGWPSIPKWACPIDPGEGKYNMCGVKAYACDLTACLNQLN